MRIWIRDLVNPRSGMEEIGTESWIRDKHPGSATLVGTDHPFLVSQSFGNNPLRKKICIYL